MDGWNTTFLLGWPIFRGYVSFRECSSSNFPELDNLRLSHTGGGGEPFFTKVYEVEVAQSLWGSILEVNIFWTQLKIRRCYYSKGNHQQNGKLPDFREMESLEIKLVPDNWRGDVKQQKTKKKKLLGDVTSQQWDIFPPSPKKEVTFITIGGPLLPIVIRSDMGSPVFNGLH